MKFIDHTIGLIFGAVRGLGLALMIIADHFVNFYLSFAQMIFNLGKGIIGLGLSSYKIFRDNVFERPHSFLAGLGNAVVFLGAILPLLIIETALRSVGAVLSMVVDWLWSDIVSIGSLITAPILSLFDGAANGFEYECKDKAPLSHECSLTKFYELYFSQNLPMNDSKAVAPVIIFDSLALSLVLTAARASHLAMVEGGYKSQPTFFQNTFLEPIRPKDDIQHSNEELVSFSRDLAFR